MHAVSVILSYGLRIHFTLHFVDSLAESRFPLPSVLTLKRNTVKHEVCIEFGLQGLHAGLRERREDIVDNACGDCKQATAKHKRWPFCVTDISVLFSLFSVVLTQASRLQYAASESEEFVQIWELVAFIVVCMVFSFYYSRYGDFDETVVQDGLLI